MTEKIQLLTGLIERPQYLEFGAVRNRERVVARALPRLPLVFGLVKAVVEHGASLGDLAGELREGTKSTTTDSMMGSVETIRFLIALEKCWWQENTILFLR